MRIIATLLLLISFSNYAQEFKFKDVSKAELEEKFHPKDSTASAAVLYENGYLTMRYDDGWLYELEVTKRVKIYNSEGYDYATVEIPYYYGNTTSGRESIQKTKAYTYNLEGNKIKDEKLRNKDFIDEEVSKNWKKLKFTFPNIKPGSVIEYTYTYASPHIDDFPEWFFQEEIPVNHSVYELVIPGYFGYNEQTKGFQTIKKDIENTIVDISFRVDSQTSSSINNNSAIYSQSGSSSVKAIKYTYQAHDVPKLKNEPFVNNLNNFMTSIKHEISYFKNPSTNAIKEFATNWKKASKNLQKSESFGAELDRTRYFEDDINPILSQSTSADEKINNIFNFVKSHMKWNNYVGIYCSDKLKKVYTERTGNIADINLMLTAMLRYAGLEAHPVLVSTIKNGIPNTTASTENYNYIIAAVELNNQVILLDASNPFTAPNLLPTRCLNWHGRLVRPNGTSKKILLNPTDLSKDNFIMNIKVDESGKISGQMRRQYTNQYAFEYRNNFSAVNQESYVKNLQNALNLNITEYKGDNIKELSKPVIETLSFNIENAVDVIDGNIYMSPLLFLAQKENPFKQNQQERKLPINFTFPKSKKYMINVDIPEGYKVDYIPKPIAIGLPNNNGLYRFNIQKTPTGDLQIIINKDLNQSILSADYYQPLKDFYKNIVNKETDKIVLVRQ